MQIAGGIWLTVKEVIDSAGARRQLNCEIAIELFDSNVQGGDANLFMSVAMPWCDGELKLSELFQIPSM